MENPGRKLVMAAATVGLMVYGVLPVVYHYVEVAQVELDVTSLMTEHGSQNVEELREYIVSSLAMREIKVDPEKIFIQRDRRTDEVHVFLRYRREVEILFFTRSFDVEVERLALSLGV